MGFTGGQCNMDLTYIFHHIFFPPQLPQNDDFCIKGDRSLCELVLLFANEYKKLLPVEQRPRWDSLSRMLRILWVSQESITLSNNHIEQSMAKMGRGGKMIHSSVLR